MSEDRYCFILNPAAGGGLAGRNWPQLHEKLRGAGIDHCHHESEYPGHGVELVKAAYESGERNFVAVGGDGTANEILNGLISVSGPDTAEFTLGAVPCGSGNDWARYYGLSRSPDDLIKSLQSASRTRQDIGRVTFTDSSGAPRDHFFLNCAGTGFDSFLLKEKETTKGSRFRYFVLLLRCLRKLRATHLQLSVDAAPFEGPALLLEICLGKFAGAGMHFAPAAEADDGLFDVLLIEGLSIPQVLRSLVYLYNGRINEHPAARNWRCRAVSIAARAGQQLHCDGELVCELPVQIEILPRALSVLTPGDQGQSA